MTGAEAVRVLEELYDSLPPGHPDRVGVRRSVEVLRDEITAETRTKPLDTSPDPCDGRPTNPPGKAHR